MQTSSVNTAKCHKYGVIRRCNAKCKCIGLRYIAFFLFYATLPRTKLNSSSFQEPCSIRYFADMDAKLIERSKFFLWNKRSEIHLLAVKKHENFPTACHFCYSSSKRAALPRASMTCRWGCKLVTRFGEIQQV